MNSVILEVRKITGMAMKFEIEFEVSLENPAFIIS
jgi:hypothetical protein